MTHDIRVVYRKFDGGLHWHLTMRWLGEDEHGVWLGLDLDVCRLRRDGEVLLLDEDEFEIHQVRYGYPARVVDRARAAAADVYAAVANGREPFVDVYRSWLAQVE